MNIAIVSTKIKEYELKDFFKIREAFRISKTSSIVNSYCERGRMQWSGIVKAMKALSHSFNNSFRLLPSSRDSRLEMHPETG